jgi:hypothetical protein
MWSAGLCTALDRVIRRNAPPPTVQNSIGIMEFLLNDVCTVSYRLASHLIQSGAERSTPKSHGIGDRPRQRC